jgi:hypothetical protein
VELWYITLVYIVVGCWWIPKLPYNLALFFWKFCFSYLREKYHLCFSFSLNFPCAYQFLADDLLLWFSKKIATIRKELIHLSTVKLLSHIHLCWDTLSFLLPQSEDFALFNAIPSSGIVHCKLSWFFPRNYILSFWLIEFTFAAHSIRK